MTEPSSVKVTEFNSALQNPPPLRGVPLNSYALRLNHALRSFVLALSCHGLSALVGSSGLEPPTSRLSGVCSNQLSYEPMRLTSLREVSSMSSPCSLPVAFPYGNRQTQSQCLASLRYVGCLLSLVPLVEMNGFEPMTPCLQSRCSPS